MVIDQKSFSLNSSNWRQFMYTIEIETVDHETQIGMQRPVKSDGTKWYIRSQVITAIDYH